MKRYSYAKIPDLPVHNQIGAVPIAGTWERIPPKGVLRKHKEPQMYPQNVSKGTMRLHHMKSYYKSIT
jgi:hypothetical protein